MVSAQVFENMTLDNFVDWLSSNDQTLDIDYAVFADNSSSIPESIVKCTSISDHLLIDEHSSSRFQLNSTRWHFALGIAYGALFIGGLTANLNTIKIIFRIHQSAVHRTSSSLSRSIFTINLLVADMLLCVFSLPFTPAVSGTGTSEWPFGSWLCKTTAGTQPAVVTVSVWSLVFVVINKYRHLCNLPSKAIPTRMAVFLTCLVWCCGILIAFPYMAVSTFVSGSQFQSVVFPGGYCGEFCIEIWPSSIAPLTDLHFVDELRTVDYSNYTNSLNYRVLCSCVFLLVNLIIPLSIITVCYVCIYTRVRQGNMLQTANAQQSAAAVGNRPWRARTQRRQRRLAYCSTAVVLGFVVCWLPILTRNFLKDLNMLPTVLLPHEAFISLLTHFLAMCSVVLNPVLLSWFASAGSATRQPPQKGSVQLSMPVMENRQNSSFTSQRYVQGRHKQKETETAIDNRVTLLKTDNSAIGEQRRLLKRPQSLSVVMQN